MGFLGLINHLLNFVAPAWVVGALVAVLAPTFGFKAAGIRLRTHVIQNAVVGVLVLFVGLWLFGRDGKMATYAALVLAVASRQWWGAR